MNGPSASTPVTPIDLAAKAPPYTSRIIKASALIPDTRLLLSEWDLQHSVQVNLERARSANIFGKASRSRIQDILKIFRQRYFDDPAVGGMLVTLAQGGATSGWIDPLLYFFSAQNDRVLRDLVVDVLYPRLQAGYSDVTVEYVTHTIHSWVLEGKTTSEWNDKTTLRVAQNALAALRDFGVLAGKTHKRVTPFYLPTPAFALAAHWLAARERSGERVLCSQDWNLFFLPVAGVERFFVDAHQEHLLGYQAAGSVIRIDFPTYDLVEYAHVVLDRTHEAVGS